MTDPRIRAAIVGIAGPSLLPEEAALFRAHPPAGAILFRRNIETPVQLAALVAQLRAALPEGAVLMLDQEGGRVARLRPPHWRGHPACGAIGALPPAQATRAAWLQGALIGLDLAASGFDVGAAPVLDRRVEGANFAAVGDRAFAEAPETVAALGRAMAEGLLAAGIQPVGKHAPGHGRANLDTHHALPVVDHAGIEADLAPFIAHAWLPWMMTAHIVYPGWDAARPGTLSPVVIRQAIRGRIGFAGVLCSDDLAMNALQGTPRDRALGALAAGCDIALYCPGDAEGNAAVLGAVPALSPPARAGMAAARALAASRRQRLDAAALAAERDALLPVG
jgi:beta-N-acetylhexosaminidase